MPLHRGPSGQKTAQCADTQRRMRVGVAAGVFAQPVTRPLDGIRRLTVAGYRIVFGVTGNRRPLAIAPDGAKGGRHTAAADLDLKALRP